MTSTARRVKKSLKEDQLVTTTFRVTEWAQEHFNQVIIGVVALVAVVAVLVFAASSRQSGSRQAERQMGVALAQFQQADFRSARESFQQVVTRHGGRQATAAQFFQAECDLRLGNYKDAIDGYDGYLRKRDGFPLFAGSAMIGKGLAYEGLQNYPEAAKAMADALKQLDSKDPRYLDTAFQTGDFYVQAGNVTEALKYYQMVANDATGDLKARATVAAAMLK